MAPQLMWIGIGSMGRPMCKNLVEHGSLDKPLVLYNRTQKRADDLSAQLGADRTSVAASLAEGVARADIIFTCLGTDAAVLETYEAIARGGGGGEGHSLAGKLFVECSTNAADTTQAAADSVLPLGAEFVASPVFGSPQVAEAGRLIFATAGPRASIDRLRPYIKGVMGRAEIALDDRPLGTAARMKLIGNSFISSMVCQLAEGLVAADRSGVGVEALTQFVDLFMAGPYPLYADRMVSGTYWRMDPPLTSCDVIIKDLKHTIRMAEEAGVEMRCPRQSLEYMEAVREHAGAKGDLAGVYGVARMRAGLAYENGGGQGEKGGSG